MPTAEVNGVGLHYQQLGRGPDLVMVHGLLSSLAFWYLGAAAALAPDFRVTVYDLRGHGRSDMPPRGYTTRDMAADLDGLLDELGLERVHLVGHSFGGAVVLHYTALHPERVLSVVEADGQIPRFQQSVLPDGSRRWRRAAARLRKLGYEVPSDLPRVARGFLEDLAAAADGSEAETPVGRVLDPNSHAYRRWSELMKATPAGRELGQPAGLTPRRIRSVRQPVLAIFGERSYCMPTLRALERNLANCSRMIVAGAGHLFPLRRPDVLASAVRSFAGTVRR
jgi:pimeloyl-ACP methyl ester carboxylesterase